MQSTIAKYLLYYPVTLLKGELVVKYLRDYRAFQWLSTKAIDDYKLDRLKVIVSLAYNQSPFYKDLYDRAGVHPDDIKELEDIKKFPKVSKQDLVDFAETIRTSHSRSILCSKKTTGGSTGRAVTVFKNPAALARERAATSIAYEWAGVEMAAPQARFWGTPLTKVNQTSYRLIDYLANRIRFSAFAIDEGNFASFFERIQKFKPRYIYGYASVVEAFAEYLDTQDKKLPGSLVSVITTSEVLTAEMRRRITEVTRLPVFNEYGCGEVGSIAHECEEGNLHVLEENLLVEIDSKGDSKDGGIVVTDFHNKAMPVIRYEVGDYGEWREESCGCGRQLSVLKNVYGRAYDILFTRAGYKVHPEYVMYIFEEIKNEGGGIKQFQIIQKNQGHLEIKVVRDECYTESTSEKIIERMKEKFGQDITVDIEFVAQVLREPSGKLRIVKNEMT